MNSELHAPTKAMNRFPNVSITTRLSNPGLFSFLIKLRKLIINMPETMLNQERTSEMYVDFGETDVCS